MLGINARDLLGREGTFYQFQRFNKKLFLFNQAMTRCQVDGTQTVEVFGSFVRYLDLDMMEIH